MTNRLKMRNYLIFLAFLFFNFLSFSQEVKDSIGFYFESSKNDWFKKPPYEWQKRNIYAVKRIGFYKGNTCGDVPNSEKIRGTIVNDTLFIDLNIKIDPFCDPTIGSAGDAIDFVINTKKYPNYKELVFFVIRTESCLTENCFILDAEDIVNQYNFQKKEMIVNKDFAGGYEKYTVYYNYNNLPIIIEKKQKLVVRYKTNQGEKEVPTYISATFYIQDWMYNKFIRIGQVKEPILDNKYDIKDYEIVKMNSIFKFDFDKQLIEKLK
jgi:hypothetical protein